MKTLIALFFLVSNIAFAQEVLPPGNSSWYQVLPVVENYFDEGEDFSLVLVKMSDSFKQTEKGTAWALTLMFPSDIQDLPEDYSVTEMAIYNENGARIALMDKEYDGQLMAILPHRIDALKDVHAFIKSNVTEVCYDLKGNPENCLSPQSAVIDYVISVKPGSEWEIKIKSWFKAALTYPMVKQYNFAKPLSEYTLKNSTK